MGYIGQAEDEWEWEQEKLRRKARAKLYTRCPTCDKKVKKVGLKDHLKDVHNQRIVPPRPKKIEVEDIV